ncbi:hypothetical protein Q0N88_11100 [Bacillus thuringiensis]|uniref:hypothetical protein n=1 Tax=Bacillus thuringiensis TaxID=1428 RepID=UPI0034575D0A
MRTSKLELKECSKIIEDDICRQVKALYQQGFNYKVIAEKLDCDYDILKYELQKRELWKGSSAEESKKRWNILCEQAVFLRTEGISYTEIARRFGYSFSTLKYQLKRRKLYDREKKLVQSQRQNLNKNRSKLKSYWEENCQRAVVLLEKGMSLKKISNQLDCDTHSLYRELKIRNMYPNETREIKRKKNLEKWDSLCKEAVLLYKQGMSYSKISQQIGCHTTTLCTELKKRGLN